jgi:hypothetical protein
VTASLKSLPSEYPEQTVYRGRDAVGAICQHGRQWLAFDIDGRKIGSFPTRLGAFSAVLRKRGGR